MNLTNTKWVILVLIAFTFHTALIFKKECVGYLSIISFQEDPLK
jgi:hypothetical protein